MPTPKKIDLKARLARYRQIKISVIGRNPGGSDGDSSCKQRTLLLQRSHRSL